MTLTTGHRVSLTPSEWLKLIMFLLVQSIALIGVGVDMRERLAIVETRLKGQDESLADVRAELAELRREFTRLQKKP